MGANIFEENNVVTITSDSKLFAGHITVPGDISSAAFFMAAAAIIPAFIPLHFLLAHL